MRTFAQKPKATQQTKPAKSTKARPTPSGQRRDVHSMLQLQRMIGNQAVQRLLRTDSESREIESSTIATAGFAHDFSRIPVHSNLHLQRTIGDQAVQRLLHDNTDLEDQIGTALETPPSTFTPFQNGAAQKIVSGTSSGRPLPPDARAAMETRFGYDFSRVRIHSDSQTAAALGAKAFTSGEHIFFRPGRSPSDRPLLAHEIAHVVQQATGEANGLQAANGGESRREALESRAEHQSRRTDHETHEPIRLLPVLPFTAPVVQFDFEEEVLRELRRLPSAEEEGLSEAERRRRAQVLSDRRARLRNLFRDLPLSEGGRIRERLSERRRGDVLSERFHDILATATRRELLGLLPRSFHFEIRVPPASDFCRPFTQEELDDGLDIEIGTAMGHFVNEDIRDFYGNETANLWEDYITRVPGDSLTPTIFDDPSSEIVQAFIRHPATRSRQRELIEAIQRTLPGNCPALPADVWTDVEITDLLSQDELNRPFSFSGVTTIPGLIAGGVSGSAAGQDSRSISGKVQFLRTTNNGATSSVRMRTHFRFLVRDAIDFCPGGMGGQLARFVTIPLSRLEASGWAYDVPFEVHYNGPPVEIELSSPVLRTCF